MTAPPGQLLEALLGAHEIQVRVQELGQEISRDYQGQELTCVGILKGSLVFLADLIRAISIPATVDFLAITPYAPRQGRQHAVRLLKDLDDPVTGRHLLIVEDIVDTGLTLGFLVRTLAARGPASVKICTLLDRPPQRIIPLPVSYHGFEIAGDFVVGYGMDYRQYYRNLPGIYRLKPEEASP